jgi:hypothetical protein
MAVIDRKGIWTFLALTFGITLAYEGCFIGSGMSMNFGLLSAFCGADAASLRTAPHRATQRRSRRRMNSSPS